MGTLDISGALKRRWYLMAVGVLMTGGLLAAAISQVGPSHEAKSSVLLVPPPLAVVGYPNRESPGNPFLRLDGLDPVVSVLITKTTSKQVSDRLLADAPAGDYQMLQDPTTQAPIIVITASGSTDAEAETVRDRVVEAMPEILQQLQVDAHVPPKAQITMTRLVDDKNATASWKPLVRMLILITAVGVVGTLLLVGAVDALARSRRRSRRRPAAPSTDDESDDENRPTDDGPDGDGGPDDRPDDDGPDDEGPDETRARSRMVRVKSS